MFLNFNAARCLVVCLAANLIAGSLPEPAAAAPVQTNFFNNTSETFYPVSSTDLINQGQPTFLNQTSTDFTVSAGSDTANFNNGTAGNASTNADLAWDADGTWATTFNFDLANAPLGYAINNIRSYAGWNSCCYGQYYTLEFSTVGDASYTSLGTFTHDSTATGPSTTYIDLTDTTGTLATAVDALRFSFFQGDASDNAMREIDVFGSAIVAPIPEPASCTLLALGIAAFCGLRTRRRASCATHGKDHRRDVETSRAQALRVQ